MRIKIRVVKPFYDIYNIKIKHLPGEILETDSEKRAITISRMELGELVSIDNDYIDKGKEVVVYTSRIFGYGGIETACYNMAKHFYDRNITFIFGKTNIEQAIRIARYRRVKIDNGDDINCDVLLMMGYDGLRNIKAKNIKARKVYQQIHADWSEMKKFSMYKNYNLDTNGIDRFLAVSETAQKGLQKAFGLDSMVVPNILTPLEPSEFRIFLSLTRLEQEKGGNILAEMIERFTRANKRFLWIVCGAGSEQGKIYNRICDNPSVIILPPSSENKGLLSKVDYLVQTSLAESYCYSIHEALSVGTPVISTDIPEARKVIKNGENGYLVDFGLTNLHIDKIFKDRPKFEAKQEVVVPVWEDVLKGKL